MIKILRDRLKKIDEKGKNSSEEDLTSEMIKIENEVHEQIKGTSYSIIPRFFKRKNSEQQRIERLLNKAARSRFLQKRKELILSEDELDIVWALLLSYASTPTQVQAERIDYSAFHYSVTSQFAHQAKINDRKIMEYFNPTLFLQFQRDESGRVLIPEYFNYILRKVGLIRNRIELCIYDEDFDNHLTRDDMRRYFHDNFHSIPQLSERFSLDNEKETGIYVNTCLEKFFFFLDPQNRGKISIDDIIGSSVFQEFQELLHDEEQGDLDNWFSPASIESVWETFKQLDFTGSGTLSRNEMSLFNGGSLTPVFVRRMMEEYVTDKSKKIDYMLFVKFLLAFEHKETPASKLFFWRILDTEKKGYLTPFTLNIFLREIIKKLREMSQGDEYLINDILQEIYSMINPRKKSGDILLQDILDCQQGGTCISLLIDVQAFWAYDNREGG